MQINILTKYSVLAHGPSKFNTANFQKNNTYFVTVVTICTKPVFLTLWTTDSCQPGKVSFVLWNITPYRCSDGPAAGMRQQNASKRRNTSTRHHGVTYQRTANFTVATVRQLNPKSCNARCLHFHQKSAKRCIRRSILLSTASFPGNADIAICTQEQYLTPLCRNLFHNFNIDGGTRADAV